MKIRNIFIIIFIIAIVPWSAIWFIMSRSADSHNIESGLYVGYSINEAPANSLVQVQLVEINNRQQYQVFSFRESEGQPLPIFRKISNDLIASYRIGGDDKNGIVSLKGQILKDIYQPPTFSFIESPTKQKISFTVFEKEHSKKSLVLVDPILKKQEILVSSSSNSDEEPPQYPSPISFSKDEQWLFFNYLTDSEGFARGLYRINLSTKTVEKIKKVDELGLVDLHIDENGNIFGLREADLDPYQERQGPTDLYRVSTDLSSVEKFNLPQDNILSIESVDPLGRYIVYLSILDGKNHLWVYDLELEIPYLIKSDESFRPELFWNEQMLTFISSSIIYGDKLYLYDVEKNQLTTLVSGESGEFIDQFGWFKI